MARREATVVIDAEGRDKGKVFRLTEVSAEVGEEWATQVFVGMLAAGVDIPDNIVNGGVAGLIAMFLGSGDPNEMPEVAAARAASLLGFGLRSVAKMPWSVSGPLYRFLMSCVMIQPDPRQPLVVRSLVENDIEEIGTRFKLRMEVLKLHAAFTEAAAP